MKKNFLIALIQTCFVTMLVAGFLNFGNVQQAQASCSYVITGPTAQSSVTKNGQLNIAASVSRSGTSGDCANTVTVVFYVKAEYLDAGGNQSTELQLTRGDINFNNASNAAITSTFNLSGFDWTNVPNQNQLQLYARVYAGSTNVTTSGIFTIAVTGSTGSSGPSGTKNITITFDRASYNSGDQVNILISLDSTTNVPAHTMINTTVNGQQVGTFPQDGSALSVAQSQATTVSAANGFVNGANTVQVQIIDFDTNFLYAQGTAQVQANISGASSSGGPSVTISPQSSSIPLGTNVVLSASNLPQGSTFVVNVNNTKNSSIVADSKGSATVTINVSSSLAGINATGNNTISFVLNDTNGNPLQIAGNPYSFTIGAQSTSPGTTPSTGTGGGTSPAVTGNCTGSSSNCLFNPVQSQDLVSLLISITKWFLGLLGIFAVIFIMVGGFRMMFAQGNEEAYSAAKKTVVWAVLGMVVAVMSFSIVAIVQNLLQSKI